MHPSVIYCSTLIGKICEHFIVKSGFALAFAGIHFLYDDALNIQMVALFILVIIDFIFGIAHAYKDPDDYVRSRKFVRTAYKLVLYFSVIAAAHVTEQAMPQMFVLQSIDETVIAFLAVTELISVLEHASNFGFDIPKKLLGQLREYRDSK